MVEDAPDSLSSVSAQLVASLDWWIKNSIEGEAGKKDQTETLVVVVIIFAAYGRVRARRRDKSIRTEVRFLLAEILLSIQMDEDDCLFFFFLPFVRV